jgi:hypothetical protein
VIGYRLDNLGIEGKEIFLGLGAEGDEHHIVWVQEAVSRGVKEPWRGVDYTRTVCAVVVLNYSGFWGERGS